VRRALPLLFFVTAFTAATLHAECARADDEPPFTPRMFFGSTFGAGLGAVRHPLLNDETAKLGVQYDPCLGFVLARHWAGCLELATWQYTVSGRPDHLHLFALRAEYLQSPTEGPVLAFALGPMLTDGIVGGQRFGPGMTFATGWRWEAWSEVSVGLFFGTHAGAYADGWGVNPFLALELRFYERL
jgi:hypothetical protein